MHASNPAAAEMVIAQGWRVAWWMRRFHFPGLVRLANGTLLVVARKGIEHVDHHGEIQVVRSTDEGETWSRPKTIVDSKGDDRDPKISVDSRGRVFLQYFTRKDEKSPKEDVHEGVYVMHSDDEGITWSEPVLVETTEPGWVASHGAVTEMPDGSLLAPVYQSGRSMVVRSTDGGLTFPASGEYTFDTGGITTNEVTLLPHSSGVVTAWIRPWTDGARSLVYRSFDSGHTWEGPEMSDIRQSSADGIELDDGRLCLIWGDLSQRFGHRRVTCTAIIDDPSKPWEPTPPTPVWDAFNYDQGNPAITKLGDGSLLVVVTDYASRQIVAKRLRPADLERPMPDEAQFHGAIDLQAMVEAGEATISTDLGGKAAQREATVVDLVTHKLGLTPNVEGSPGQHSAHVIVEFRKPQQLHEVGVALRPGENQDATIAVQDANGPWHRIGSLVHAWRYGDVDWFPVGSIERVIAVRVVTRVSDGPRPPKSRGPLPAAITQVALR